MAAESTASAVDWVEQQFRDIEQSEGSKAGALLRHVRRDAFARFSELGFPTPKLEEWKYTNVAPIARTQFAPGQGSVRPAVDQLRAYGLLSAGYPRAVFIDGRFESSLSSLGGLPEGVRVSSIARLLQNAADPDHAVLEQHLCKHASYADQAFVALNTAFIQDGACVVVDPKAVCTEPIQLLFLSTAESEDTVAHPRILVHAGESSQASLIESYGALGGARYFTSSVSEVVVEENAVFDHYKLQFEGEAAYHVSLTEIVQASNSNYAHQSFSFGGGLVRNDVNPTLSGEGIETTLNGLSVLRGTQHVDNHTCIDHAKPNCLSHEWYKGIYAGESRGVFNGTIIVRQDAQKTNAIQNNQALLLSNEAEIDSKPQLKIWADDVRCTHGATVGQLDDEALFYLRSRGIPKAAARDILIRGFAEDVVNQVKSEELRELLEEALLSKLQTV